MSDLQHLYNRQDTHRSALYRQRDSNAFNQVVENLIGICDGPHIWGIDIFFIPKRLHEATDSDIDTLPVKVQEIISDIQSDEALILEPPTGYHSTSPFQPLYFQYFRPNASPLLNHSHR